MSASTLVDEARKLTLTEYLALNQVLSELSVAQAKLRTVLQEIGLDPDKRYSFNRQVGTIKES